MKHDNSYINLITKAGQLFPYKYNSRLLLEGRLIKQKLKVQGFLITRVNPFTR